MKLLYHKKGRWWASHGVVLLVIVVVVAVVVVVEVVVEVVDHYNLRHRKAVSSRPPILCHDRKQEVNVVAALHSCIDHCDQVREEFFSPTTRRL